jgi:hypothetical protein
VSNSSLGVNGFATTAAAPSDCAAERKIPPNAPDMAMILVAGKLFLIIGMVSSPSCTGITRSTAPEPDDLHAHVGRGMALAIDDLPRRDAQGTSPAADYVN